MIRFSVKGASFSLNLVEEEDLDRLARAVSQAFCENNPRLLVLGVSAEEWYPVAIDQCRCALDDGFALTINDETDGRIVAFLLLADFVNKKGDHDRITHYPFQALPFRLQKLLYVQTKFYEPLIEAGNRYLAQEKQFDTNQRGLLLHGLKGGVLSGFNQQKFLLLLNHVAHLLGSKLGYQGLWGIATHPVTAGFTTKIEHEQARDMIFVQTRKFVDYPPFAKLDPNSYAALIITDTKPFYTDSVIESTFNIPVSTLQHEIELFAAKIKLHKRLGITSKL